MRIHTPARLWHSGSGSPGTDDRALNIWDKTFTIEVITASLVAVLVLGVAVYYSI